MFSCRVEDVYFPPSRQNECCVIRSDLSIRFHVVSSGTRFGFDEDAVLLLLTGQSAQSHLLQVVRVRDNLELSEV